MAPPYLSGNVYYQQDAAVVDVNTIIASIKALALAATPAWTNPGGAGTIVSPADASGRQMTITFTRIAATNLEFTVTDGAGRTMTRRAQIAGAGSTVNYFIGQFHMVLDWTNAGTPEGMLAIMLDESPEAQTSHNRWLVATSSRDAANTNDSRWTYGTLFVIRSADAFAVLANGILAMALNISAAQPNLGILNRTIGGSNVWFPIIAMGDSTLNIFNIFGKLYQCLNIKSLWVPIGSEVSVPIDQSTSVIFKVLSMPSWNPGGAVTNDRMAVRKT